MFLAPSPVLALLYDEDFDHGSVEAPQVQVGSWRFVDDPDGEHDGDQCYLGTAPAGGSAMGTQPLEGPLPLNLHVQVTFNAEDVVPGQRWSNAFVIFDCQSPTDFKFAGAFVGIDRWVIGHSASNPDGYLIDGVLSVQMMGSNASDLRVTGPGEPVVAADTDEPICDFDIRGCGGPANLLDGGLGVGTILAATYFDDIHVDEL